MTHATTKTTAAKTYAVKCGECKVTVRRSHQRGTRETCPQCRAKADAMYLARQSPAAADSATVQSALAAIWGAR